MKPRIKWAWHIASTGKMKNAYKFCFGSLKAGEHLGDWCRREDNI
jgi:hypothetical protein